MPAPTTYRFHYRPLKVSSGPRLLQAELLDKLLPHNHCPWEAATVRSVHESWVIECKFIHDSEAERVAELTALMRLESAR